LATIHTVDCEYVEPGKAASFLMIEGNRAAFVDNNTVHAVPLLLKSLDDQGLSPEQVDFLIITHVHLDHAGGTAALLKHCPNATVLAHPKAARHLIEPSRLIAGAKGVYGEEAFARLYGVIEPVEAARVRVMQDGESLPWGSRTLRFIYTPGHASHHFCIYDSRSNGIFTGDAFGLGPADPATRISEFIVCTSAPPDFDAVEARKTVRKILDTGAEYVYLPHFGIHAQPARNAEMLLVSVGRMEKILEDAVAADIADNALYSFCEERLIAATKAHLEWCRVQDMEAAWHWLGDDPQINAMGLAHAARQRRKSAALQGN